jgi:class 3 adenylate cyclase/tetratricopeptide (TPR) repeat protein
VSDVSAWLHRLGLGKYAKAFEDNEIEFDFLPHVTENMLEQIGVPVGPRAKLLAAISELGSPPADQSEFEPDEGVKGRSTIQPRPAERRQITVMFCDLVDSTKFANDLDPEDFKTVMHAYQRACGAVVERYGGHVSQYHGDGLEVYFGYPVAHEDDAERAVRAGLAVIEAVTAIAGPRPLSVRVGISTGIVVISETGSGDPSIPSSAIGDTPHIAARLQAIAAPNSVVIAEVTRRLISVRFDQEELGPQNLKGIAEPVHAFRVRHVHEDSNRFQAGRAAALTPLVGRRTELALLQQRWRDAKGGEGQVLYVCGVPGIGKSRVVHELDHWIGRQSHFSLKFQCSPHHMQSAFFPVIQQIKRLCELADNDSDRVKLDKIEKLLAKATKQVDRVVPLVAEMISIPSESRYAPLELTATQKKAHTLFVLVDLLLGLSDRRPVLCLLEDAQWIDPSTQELLDLIAGRTEKARILLVVTHRPEYQVRSGVYGNVSGLTLSRLPRREVVEMTQLALRKHSVSTAVMNRIVDESDSIPLFIEELARGALESGGIEQRAASNQRAEPSASWLVPDSLRDSLVARLDRAPQGRSIAQMAAVIGREFSYDMLLRVSNLSSSELDLTLAHLQQSEIIQQIDDRPSARYVFKHALLRDAAYESLLRSTRREVHARVGAILEKERPEIVTDEPELLAYHYSLAGNAEFAVIYWSHGGQRARNRSANFEAIVQFQKALEFLNLLPETPERLSRELELQLSLGVCFIAARGYSADDTRSSFERARTLSEELGEPRKEIQAMFGLALHYWVRAQHDRAIELGETLLAKAEELKDPVALTVAHRVLGSTLFTLGDFVRAREHLERAVALKQQAPANGRSLFLSYAVDPRIAAQLILAWDMWNLGYPEQAHRYVVEALAQALKQADAYTIAFAHYVTCAVQLLRGEFQNSLAHADRSLALSKEHHIELYALYSQFGRGHALAKTGRKERAVAEIQEAIEEAHRSNLGHMRGFLRGWLVTILVEIEDPETALSTVDDALKQVNDVTGRAWEAELRRLRGDILLVVSANAVDEAERSYNDAIAIAQSQCARSLELRASISLARLLRSRGRNAEARERLALIYGWFTEGFDTLDLKQAKALLSELAQ